MLKNPILSLPPPDDALVKWLQSELGATAMSPLSGDASARRYYRARRKDGRACVVMVSPQSEKPAQFLKVREFLQSNGVRVPGLFAADSALGFAALEDFGGCDYLSAIVNCDHQEQDSSKNDLLYRSAWRALIGMQMLAPPSDLPLYDDALLRSEMELFPQWYRKRRMEKPFSDSERKVFDRAVDFLAQECMSQPQVFVHRDYHSRNLMDIGESSPGILDFQDAVVGSAAYDMVSLLRDAYVDWPSQQQNKWLEQYRQDAKDADAPVQTDADALWRDFNVAGAQRGLKVVGIFARLFYRDGKDAYLRDLPLAYRHLLAACQTLPELSELSDILQTTVPEDAQPDSCKS